MNKKVKIVLIVILILLIIIGIALYLYLKPIKVDINTENKLYIKQTAVYDNLTIKLNSINDLCPKGDQCIIGGKAYTININGKDVKMNSSSNSSYEIDNYKVVLTEESGNNYMSFVINKKTSTKVE